MAQMHHTSKGCSSNCFEALGWHKQLGPNDRQDAEDPGEYCYGGYHPVQIGDVFNRRYQVLSKLGWGYFATVWLCLDLRLGRQVAVKVLKSGPGFAQAGQDELTLLQCAGGFASRHFYSQKVVRLLDEFKVLSLTAGVQTSVWCWSCWALTSGGYCCAVGVLHCPGLSPNKF